ncbi:TfoX/Sxy family DNA transformation protein [Persicimonas caeni]|nr:TfoX/Sxy family DNA transformation protein [Persicimonas caeni]
MNLADARNLGPRSAEMLADAGLLDLQEVRDLGAAECFRRVRMVHPKVSLNLLWALEGAVTDRDWRDIDDRRKRELRRAVGAAKPR